MPHFSEMDFLFVKNSETNPSSTIRNLSKGGGTEGGVSSIFKEYNTTGGDHYFVFKGGVGSRRELTFDRKNAITNEFRSGNYQGNNKIIEYYRSTIYEDNQPSNPYVNLINQFNGVNSARALLIRPSDIAYLRDLGVYPLNRMVILRRFAEGIIVPEKLDELGFTNENKGTGEKVFTGEEPISVVVGWLKPDDNFGQISFNESWTTTNTRLDELLAKIIKEEFFKGSNLTSIMPVPNFAQGLLFELLNRMDLTGGEDSPWDWDDIPIGDPNVLMEGPYRDASRQNLNSTLNFTFETTYEQKFIGDVDPGSAMVDIIDNLLKMGTSNMKYWLNGQSGIMQDAKAAANTGDANDLGAWWRLVNSVLNKLWDAIAGTIKGAISGATNAIETGTFKEYATDKLAALAKSILTATIAKYRWELKGSIELMTGRDSTTPWYLTIGNPFSPWLATNHIILNSVKIDTSPEVGFNDMPLWIKVEFVCSQSRNLGRNEIIRMFNNSFLRQYSRATAKELKISDAQNKDLTSINQSKASDVAMQIPDEENVDDFPFNTESIASKGYNQGTSYTNPPYNQNNIT